MGFQLPHLAIDPERLRDTCDRLRIALPSGVPASLLDFQPRFGDGHGALSVVLQSVLDGFRRHFDRVRGLSFTPAQHISWRRATASRALFDELRSAWIARLDRQLGASARERIPLILREPWVGVLDVFGKEEDENAHSDVLRWLLDPFCASTVAPQLLRRLIGAAAKDAESLWRTVELAIARGSFSAVREERLDPECRIDILLATPDVFIAIENKEVASGGVETEKAVIPFPLPSEGRSRPRKESTAVREKTTEARVESRPWWEGLESWLRVKVQDLIQAVLEEEVTELLGRRKSERRSVVDPEAGYRNGHGKPRKLTLSCGTVTVRRPRVRGLEERFESRVLPLFARRTKEVDDLLPELYLHGLAQGDFDLALRGLLGDDAPLSASTVARLKEKWQGELDEWRQRRLDDLEVTYLWVDGVYVKAGLEKEKAAVLVALAGLSDGRKVVLTIVPGHRESTESWSAVLRDLKERGMGCPKFVVGDGHLGIWAGLRNVFPQAKEGRCWNHRILNVLDKVPKKQHRQAKLYLKAIPYADSRAEAERLKSKFQGWCRKQGHHAAAELLDKDWERMVAFYEFPKEHWLHLRTTNPVESPFAALRLRTDASKRFKKVESATAILWKLLMVAEKKFRRLDGTELVREVYLGVQFQDGVRVKKQNVKDRDRVAA